MARSRTSTPTPKPPKASSSSPTIRETAKPPWIPIAAASGACAAINGVFAKLTTTELTTSWASNIANIVGLDSSSWGEKSVEYGVRGLCLLLNILFNALMWTLFTMALTRGSSTTRVSIINTSANFLLTAFAGWAVFGEGLSGRWLVGAGMLVIGNVIIGRREGAEAGEKGERG